MRLPLARLLKKGVSLSFHPAVTQVASGGVSGSEKVEEEADFLFLPPRERHNDLFRRPPGFSCPQRVSVQVLGKGLGTDPSCTALVHPLEDNLCSLAQEQPEVKKDQRLHFYLRARCAFRREHAPAAFISGSVRCSCVESRRVSLISPG